MQYAEHYEIRIHLDGKTNVLSLPQHTPEHEAWNEYDALIMRQAPGQRTELVRVSEVVLGQAAKAGNPRTR